MKNIHTTIFLASLLTFGLLTSGCARKVNESDSFFTYSFKSAQQLAAEAVVTCPDGRCSPSVAMLIGINAVQDGFELERCTGFLVAPDVMATASHCIPKDLKQSGSSCAGKVWAIFADQPNFSQAKIECAEVLAAGDLFDPGDSRNRDYAFIRLSQAVGRPYLNPSFKAVEIGERFTNFRLHPTEKGLEGYFETKECTVTSKVAGIKDYRGIPVAQIEFDECDSQKGNSGSPLVDGRGFVRSILSSVYTLKHVRTGEIDPQSVAATVNLACVPFPKILGIHAEASVCR